MDLGVEKVKKLIIYILTIGVSFYLIVEYTCLGCDFMSKEFTGEVVGASTRSGRLIIDVRKSNGQEKKITLVRMRNPFPTDLSVRSSSQEVLDIAGNQQVRVKVIEWQSRNEGTGLIYLDDRDIAIHLLREGYLLLISGGNIEVDLRTYTSYEEAQGDALKEKKGIWIVGECLEK